MRYKLKCKNKSGKRIVCDNLNSSELFINYLTILYILLCIHAYHRHIVSFIDLKSNRIIKSILENTFVKFA